MSKKHFFIVAIIIVLCFIISCKKNQKLNANNSVGLSVDSTSLNLRDSIQFYELRSLRNNKNLVWIHNLKNQRYEFYDWQKKRFLFAINLNNFNSFGDFYDLYYLNDDTIFLFQEFQISTIDTTGKIKNAISLIVNDSTEYYYGSFNANFPLYGDGNLIFLQRASLRCGTDFSACLGEPIEAAITIDSLKIKNIPVYLPSYFKEDKGQLKQVQRSFNENFHYYSFIGHPAVFIYDKTKQKMKTKELKSMLDDEDYKQPVSSIEKLNDFQVLKLFIEHPHYSTLYFIAEQKIFVRFFRGRINEKNERNFFNGFNDKPTHIMVFNDNFQKILEEKISPTLFLDCPLVFKDAIYVIKNVEKNTISFQKYYFSKN